jgi:hypothetical protein
MATNKHPFKSPGGLDGQQAGVLARQIDGYDSGPDVEKLQIAGFKPALAAELVAQMKSRVPDRAKLIAAGASAVLAEIFELAISGRGM